MKILRIKGRLIHTRDDRETVIEKIGQPDDTRRYQNRGHTIQEWIYREGNGTYVVTFLGSRCSGLNFVQHTG